MFGISVSYAETRDLYRMYSIRYRSIPVRAVPVPVITAVISPKNTVTAVFPRITAVISSLAETSEPIDIAFGGQTRVCPNNHELDGGCRSPTGRSSYEGGLYLGYLRRNQSTCRCSCNVDHPCPKVAGTHLQPLGRRTGGHPRPPTGDTRVGPGSHTRTSAGMGWSSRPGSAMLVWINLWEMFATATSIKWALLVG